MKQNILIITAIIAVLGLYIFIQAQKHTTFGEKVQDQLDGGEVLGVTVTEFEENEADIPRYPDRVARVTLDEEVSHALLSELETLGMRQVEGFFEWPSYRIEISYVVEVQERHSQHSTIYFELNGNLINADRTYQLKEDVNLVQLIEELLEEQGVAWEDLRN